MLSGTLKQGIHGEKSSSQYKMFEEIGKFSENGLTNRFPAGRSDLLISQSLFHLIFSLSLNQLKYWFSIHAVYI
jgi:hypothetical protein